MVRVPSPAKLRPWSELTSKMVMGVVPGLVDKIGTPPHVTLQVIVYDPSKNSSRAAKRGFQTGGFPDLDLSFLFGPFWDFPDFSGFS